MKFHVTALVCVLMGCSGSESDTSSPTIYGGSKVKTGSWQNTVGIVDEGGLFCTGTALTPDLIITAAHCVVERRASQLSVYVGQGAENSDVLGQYRVSSLSYSPLYDEYDPDSNHDIAYLLLSRSLEIPESAYIPLAIDAAERNELIAVGRSARLVGFGEREDGSYGVKYEVTAKITEVGRTEVTIGGKGKDSCYGDSGGPAFGRLSNGEWRVYGVVSRGDDCGKGGIRGLIHEDLCWIQEDSGINLDYTEDFCRI